MVQSLLLLFSADDLCDKVPDDDEEGTGGDYE